MTYLPQLHRILVEGAERLEREALGVAAASERARHGARIALALRRLRRRRLFVFAALGLLLAGSAAAAVGLLESQPSAPLSGSAHVSPGPAASPLTGARYSVSVTPNLNGGAASWCITERVKSPTGIPFGNASALRALLVDTRTFLDRSIARDAGSQALQAPGKIGVLTPAQATRAEHTISAKVAALLKGLAQPARVRATAAFQQPYREFLGRFAVHGGAQETSSCGNLTRRGNPFVAADASSGGTVGAGIESGVYLTASEVAYVRISPTLTIRTEANPQLPDGFRIAVAVEQTQGGLGGPRRPPSLAGTPVALDRHGNAISGRTGTTATSEPAVFWQAQPTHGAHPLGPAAPTRPPAGACEINTNSLPGVDLFFGEVVRHLHGFPQLTTRTFLSCAYTEFAYHGYGIQAAILLDAQHPGAAPAALPNSTAIRRRPETLSEPAIQGAGTQYITGRRIGNAWLVVETAGPVPQRLGVLDHLNACVHINGGCP
jgi:hypothetical protein